MHYAIVDMVADDLDTGCNSTSTLLRTVALLTFVSLVVGDILETYEMHNWLCALPLAEAPESLRLLQFTERDMPPGGKNKFVLPVSGIARSERTLFYLACLLPKLVVAVACLLAGAGAVLRSGDNFNLVLNAVAATFILQIDDSVYTLLISDRV